MVDYIYLNIRCLNNDKSTPSKMSAIVCTLPAEYCICPLQAEAA